MAENDNVKRLEMRIAKLEEMIGQMGARRAPAEVTAEEIKAYQKVRDVLAADWGEFCGINDCFRCIIVRCITRCIALCDVVCRPCDVECSCGPCNMGGLGGRLRRFSDLGD